MAATTSFGQGSTQYPEGSVTYSVSENSDGSETVTAEARSNKDKSIVVTASKKIEPGEKPSKVTKEMSEVAYMGMLTAEVYAGKVVAGPNGEGDDKSGGTIGPIVTIIIGDTTKIPEGRKEIPDGSAIFKYKNVEAFEAKFDQDLEAFFSK